MKKYFALKILIFIGGLNLNAQMDLSNTCVDAPIICNLDGFSTMMPTGYNSIDVPATFCGQVVNNQWLSFIAGSDTLIFDISIYECGVLSEGGSIQAHVYTLCGLPWSPISNCIYEIGLNSSETIYIYNLTVGDKYYLMLDGGGNNPACTVSIDVTEGFTTSPNSPIPLQADAGEDILLNCLTGEGTLDGSNSVYGTNDSIAWVNEDLEILSDSITFTTSESGLYYFIIQDFGGGCESIDEVEVLSFNDVLSSPFLYPFINIFTDTIGQVVNLDAVNSNAVNFNAIDSNYIFLWTTNDGNIVAHPDSLYPLISSSGIYTLEITHPETGCLVANEVLVNIINPVSVFSPIKNTLQVEIITTVTNDEIRVHYVIGNTTSVSMHIFNIGGVLLQGFNFGKKQAGKHVENLSLKDFTAGVYFVFVKTEEGSAVRKVVKL